MTDVRQARLIRPGEGPQLDYPGQELYYKLRGDDTQGRLSIVEFVMPAGLEGPPLHTDNHDEVFIVLNGDMTFQVGDNVVQAGDGSIVFAPENARHTFANHAVRPARFLVMFSPAGFEGFFAEVLEAVAGGPLDPAKVLPISTRYGTNYLGLPKWRQ